MYTYTSYREILQGPGWGLDYWRLEEANALLKQARDLPLLDHPLIEGTTARTQRNVGVFSDDAPGYYLSKQSNFFVRSQPFATWMRALLAATNHLCEDEYNMILVNLYVDGNDSIGPHFDEPTADGIHGVLTISLGATRTYRLRSRDGDDRCHDVRVHHGDVLRMREKFQLVWTHEVPKEPECKETRISLTFRRVLPELPRRPREPREMQPRACQVCQKPTPFSSGVCKPCFAQKLFTCPQCQTPTGAPWLCITCFLSTK